MNKSFDAKKIALGAVLTALVIILQLLGSFIKFGMFSISLVLVPIVIGAATCGVAVGSWLGFVFGATVLLSGDASAFFVINPFGTVVTVLLKGIACGFFAGSVFDILKKKSENLAVITSAIICPIVNTGVFVLGSFLFFLDTITEWAGGGSAVAYVFTGLVGFNFFFELGVNLVLGPIIIKLLKYSKMKF